MNALQPPSRPSSSASSSRQVAPRKRRMSRRNLHRAIAFEASVKIGVNLVLAITAVSALVRLVPYNMAQQQRLKELQVEVAAMEEQVAALRAEFDRHFDPQQAMSVMQEQSARVNPNQRQVFWMAPSNTTAQESQAPSKDSESADDSDQQRETWTARDGGTQEFFRD